MSGGLWGGFGRRALASAVALACAIGLTSGTAVAAGPGAGRLVYEDRLSCDGDVADWASAWPARGSIGKDRTFGAASVSGEFRGPKGSTAEWGVVPARGFPGADGLDKRLAGQVLALPGVGVEPYDLTLRFPKPQRAQFMVSGLESAATGLQIVGDHGVVPRGFAKAENGVRTTRTAQALQVLPAAAPAAGLPYAPVNAADVVFDRPVSAVTVRVVATGARGPKAFVQIGSIRGCAAQQERRGLVADLSIGRAGAPHPEVVVAGTPPPGGTVDVKTTVTNYGPSTTRGEAALTVKFPARTKPAPGVALPADCTAEADGTAKCSIAAGFAVGAAKDFVFKALVDSAATPGATLLGGVATVAGSEDGVADNNEAKFRIRLAAAAVSDLNVKAAVDPATEVSPGSAAKVKVTVTNAGPSDTNAVSTVTVKLPDKVKPGTAPAGCTATATGFTCTIAKGLGNGAASVFELPVTIDPGAPLDSALDQGEAEVANAEDPEVTDNTAAFEFKTAKQAESDVDLTVTVDPNVAIEPGKPAKLTVTVGNKGPSDTGSVSTVTVTLPDHVRPGDLTGTGCTSADAKKITCEIAKGLKAGDGRPFEIPVKLDPGTPPGRRLAGEAEVANPDDAKPADNKKDFTVTTTDKVAVDLSVAIARPAAVPPGGTAEVKVEVNNGGPSDTVAGPTVTVTLPPKTTFAGVTGATCTGTGPLVCTVAKVAAGSSQAFTVKVTADPDVALGKPLTGGKAEAEVGEPTQETDTTTGDTAPFEVPITATASSDLTVTATGPTGPQSPGATVKVTVTPKNEGPSDTATDTTVTITLPAETSVDGALPTRCEAAGQVITCTVPAGVKAGRNGPALEIPVKIAADAERGKTLDVPAVVRNEDDPDQGDVDKNTATAKIEVGAPKLAVTKAVSPDKPFPGSQVTYTVTAENDGDSEYVGASLTDDLKGVLDDATFTAGSAKATVNGAAVASPAVDSTKGAEKLTWTGDLAKDAKLVLTYRATVNDPMKGDQRLVNKVAAAGPGSNCSAGSAGAGACTTSTDLPQLTIKKSSDVGAVRVGGQVAYKVEIANTGTGSTGNITVTDLLKDVLNEAAYKSGSVTSGPGTIALDSTKDAEKLTWTGALDAGAKAVIEYSVKVTDTTGTGDVLTDYQLSNRVEAPYGNCAMLGADSRDCVNKVGIAEVKVVKYADRAGVQEKDKVTYTITAENPGKAAATGITVTDKQAGLTDDATYGDDAKAQLDGTDAGTLDRDPGTNELTWKGDIPAGKTVTITYTATVNAPPAGDDALKNEVTTKPIGNCAHGTEKDCFSIVPIANPVVTKTAAPQNAEPGDKITYTVAVDNRGTGTAKGMKLTDDLAEVLENAAYDDGSLTVDGTADAALDAAVKAGGKLDLARDFPARTKVTYTYSVTLKKRGLTSYELVNPVVTNLGNCDPAKNPTDCEATVKVADLEIKKEQRPAAGPVNPGDTVEYLVSVRNPGAADAAAVQIEDDLSKVLADADLVTPLTQPATGTLAAGGKGLTWTGAVPAGQTITFTYRAKVKADGLTGGGLTNAIAAPYGNCGPDSTAKTGCSVAVHTPVIQFSKTSNAGAVVYPGQPVTYTVTVKNTGAAAKAGYEWSDDLTEVLKLADFVTGSVTGTPKPVLTGSTLAWKGTVPGRTTLTFTYRVQVKDPVTAGRKLVNKINGGTDSSCPTGTEPGCSTGENPATTTGKPTMTFKKTSDAAGKTVYPGQVVTYTVQVSNTGDAGNDAYEWSDDLSKVFGLADWRADGLKAASTDTGRTVEVPTLTGAKLTWGKHKVAKGETLTFTYKVQIKDKAEAGKALVNSVDGGAESNCPSGTTSKECVTGTDPETVTGEPDVVFKKISDAQGTSVYPGQPVTYTVTVENRGEAAKDDYEWSDDLTKVLELADWKGPVTPFPAGTTTAPGASGKVLKWKGEVPAKTKLTFTYRVQLKDPLPEGRRLVNAVTGPDGSNCPPGTTSPECVTGENPPTETGRPDMTFEKTSDVAGKTVYPGQVVTYTVKVTNAGDAGKPGYQWSDDLSKVFELARWRNLVTAASSDSGRTVAPPVLTGDKLTWGKDRVAKGETLTFTYKVQLKDDVAEGKSLVNSVDGGPISNCPPGSTNPKCVTGEDPKTDTGKADVVFEKKSDAGAIVLPGQTVTYTVTMENKGTAGKDPVSWTDDLTKVLELADWKGMSGTVPAGTLVQPDAAGKVLKWTGALAKGAKLTFAYKVEMKDPLPEGKPLTNAVTGPDGSNCPPGTDSPKCVTGDDPPTRTGRPDLRLDKSADVTGKVLPGQAIAYTVKVTNSGTAAKDDFEWSDDLSGVLDDARFEAGSIKAAPAGTALPVYDKGTKKLTWGKAKVPVGTLTFSYSVTVNDPATGDGKVGNVVVADGTNCPPGNTNPKCRSGKDPETEVGTPGITFEKKSDVPAGEKVLPGRMVTYKVTVENTGTADKGDYAWSDDLSGVLDDASFEKTSIKAEPAGTALPTYDERGKKLTWGKAKVVKGAKLTFTYTVRVNDPKSGDGKLGNQVDGGPDSNCPPGSTNPRCQSGKQPETEVGTPGITFKKVSDPAKGEVRPGNPVKYTVTVENTGTADMDGYEWSDDLTGVVDDADFDTTSIKATPAGTPVPVYDAAARSLKWGKSKVVKGATLTFTYRVVMKDVDPPTGDGKLVNAVDGGPESNCPKGSTNPKCKTGTDPDAITPGRPEVEFKKVSAPAKGEVLAGHEVTYTVTVTNKGTAEKKDYTWSDDLTGVLDDADWLNKVTGTPAPKFAAGKLTWTGDLAAGETKTFTYAVRMKDPTPAGRADGKLVNSVDGPDSNCPKGSTNPKCKTGTDPDTITPGKPVMDVRKTSDGEGQAIKAGHELTYTVTVKNTGAAEKKDYEWSDDLSGVLDGADLLEKSITARPDGTAKPVFTGPTLKWQGDVPAGATYSFAYKVRVKDPIPTSGTDGKLVNALNGGADSNCPPGSTNPKCRTGDNDPPTTIDKPQLDLRKVSDPPAGSKVLAGHTVTYTVTVKNSGTGDKAGYVWSDDLTGLLTAADLVPGSITASGSAAKPELKGSRLAWKGDVAAGKTYTFTYQVRVKDPAVAGGQLVNGVDGGPDSNCPPGSTSPKCRTGEEPETTTGDPDVVFKKKSSLKPPAKALAGHTVTYTVTVKNNGTADKDSYAWSDDLSLMKDVADYVPGSAKVTKGSAAAPGYDAATRKLAWTGTLVKGADLEFTYQVRIKDPLPAGQLGSSLLNKIDGGADSNCPPGSTNPACQTGGEPPTPVGEPKIKFAKTSVPAGGKVLAGHEVAYKVTVTNTGTAPETGYTWSDDLSGVLAAADLLTGSIAATDGVRDVAKPALDGARLAWTGDIPASATFIFTYKVRVKDPVPAGGTDGKLVNRVDGGDKSNCPRGNTNPVCGTGEEPETTVGDPRMSLEKKSDAPAGGKVRAGHTLTYTVTMKNTGTAGTKDYAWSDDLSGVLAAADLVTGSITASGGAAKPALKGTKLEWKGDVAAGKTYTFTYQARVKDPAVPGGKLVNAIDGGPDSNCPPGSTSPKCKTGDQPPTTVEDPAIRIRKTADPAGKVLAGHSVTFTVTVENIGTAGKTGYEWSDDLTELKAMADIEAGSITAPDAVGKPVYHDPKLTWKGDVPAKAKHIFTYKVRVKDPLPDAQTGLKLVNKIDGGADSTCPPGSTNPRCSTGTDPETVVGRPDVDFQKTSNAPATGKALAGSTITYTVTVKNKGTAGKPGYTWSDDLTGVLDAADLVPGSIRAEPDGTAKPAFDQGSKKLTWTGALPVGAGRTFTYKVRVKDPVPATGTDGKLTNQVSGGEDSNCPPGSTNPRCRTGDEPPTEVGDPDVRFSKKSSAKPGAKVPAGHELAYTVTVQNAGTAAQDPYSWSDDLSGVLDAADLLTASITAKDEAGAEVAKPVFTSPALKWNGALPAKAMYTFTYKVRVKDPVPATGTDGKLVNKVDGGDRSNCPPGNTNPACATGDEPPTEVGTPQMNVKKIADPAGGKVLAGHDVSYTVTVANGGSAEKKGYEWSDDLTGLLGAADFLDKTVTASGGASKPALDGRTLRWKGDVPAGTTYTFTYKVRVKDPATAGGTLVNAIDGGPDSNCPPGSTAPKCQTGKEPPTTTGDPDVRFKKESSAKPGDKVMAGHPVTYTVTAENTGTADKDPYTWSDDLTGVLELADFVAGSITATGGGRPALNGKKLEWTGKLPAAAKYVFTYQVRIKDPLPAGKGGAKLVNAIDGGAESNCPPGSTNPACSTGDGDPGTIVGKPQMQVGKTSSAKAGETVPAGSAVTYTVTVANTGEAAMDPYEWSDDGTTLSEQADLLPDSITARDDADPGATIALPGWDASAKKLSWKHAVPAKTTYVFTYQVRIKDPLPDTAVGKKLINKLDGGTDSNCPPGSTNPACSTGDGDPGTIVGKPEMELKKVSDAGSPVPAGHTVTYTVTVANNGKADKKGYEWKDDLSKVLDDAVLIEPLAAGLTRTGPVLSWKGDVPVAKTLTFTYQVRVKDPLEGDRKLVNSLSGEGSNCPPGNTNPNCQTGTVPPTVTDEPKVEIVKESEPRSGAVLPGGPVHYTVKVRNPGSAPVTTTFTDDLKDVLDDADLVRPLPAGLTFDAAAAKLTWTGTVKAGDTVEVTYRVRIKDPLPPAENHKVTNHVVGGKDSNCPPGNTNPRCKTGVDGGTSSPGKVVLDLEKSADPAKGEVPPGGTVTYTVTMTNPDTRPVASFTWMDDLSKVLDDADLETGGLAAQGLTFDAAKKGLAWTGEAKPGPRKFSYTVRLKDPTPPAGADGKLVNKLVADHSNCAPGSLSGRCTTGALAGEELTPGGPKADLKVTLVPPAGHTAGAEATYQVKVTNRGPSRATGTKVTFPLDDNLEFVGAGHPGCTPATTAGKNVVTCDLGDLNRGAETTSNIKVKPKPGTGPGTEVTAEATVESGTEELEPGDNKATTKIRVTAEVDLKVTLTGPKDFTPGKRADYTIDVDNLGPSDAADHTITIDLDPRVDFTTADPACAVTGGRLVCSAKELKAGERTSVLVTGAAKASIKGPDRVKVTAEVATTSPEPAGKLADNTATTMADIFRLAIAKKADRTEVRPGGAVTYTVTVTNEGTRSYKDATFTDDLTGVLADGAYDKAAKASAGKVDYTEPNLNWTGDILLGTPVTVTYKVLIPRLPKQGGKLALDNQVRSASPGANCQAASAGPECGVKVGIANPTIDKQVDSTVTDPGSLVGYTLTITNAGGAPARNLAVADNLAGVLDDATFQPASLGADDRTGNQVTPRPVYDAKARKLTWTGTVPAYDLIKIRYKVKVNKPDTGNQVLNNTVVSNEANCKTGSKDAKCTTATRLRISVTKSADKKVLKPREKLTYTATVTNHGSTVYKGFRLIDDLKDVLDDATYNNNAKAVSGGGRISYAKPKITWTGDLAPRRTVKITYSVTRIRGKGNNKIVNSLSTPYGAGIKVLTK